MTVNQIRKTCSSVIATQLLALALLVVGEVAAQDAQAQSAPAAQPQPPIQPLLYFFEHAALREAALRYDQDIQRLIANPRQAGEPVTRLFAKAALYAASVPTFRSETMVEDMTRFMSRIGFETIRKGGYTIHLMRMPPPEFPPEAYFVAIVYKDGEPLIEGTPAPSTRYITFEKTSVTGRAVALGEWDVNGKHKLHGFGDQEPTLRSVVSNVYALLGIEGS
jgi:hypothetical protein